MPTYEYKCTNDGSTFDLWQEVGSSAPPCPDCGAPSKKVFAPPRVIFKGPGFYVTDKRAESSGGGSKSAPAQAKSDEKSSDAAAGENKTETRTEGKTEAPKAENPKTDAKSD